jgi:hypothetical protein
MMQPPTATASCFGGRCVGVEAGEPVDDEQAATPASRTAAANVADRRRWVRRREALAARRDSECTGEGYLPSLDVTRRFGGLVRNPGQALIGAVSVG